MTAHDSAIFFSSLCAQDAHLSALLDKYDSDPSAMSDAEFTAMCDRMDEILSSPPMEDLFFQSLINEEEEDW